MSDYLEKAREIIEIEISGLHALSKSLDSGFESAIDVMKACLEAKGKIVVTGIGKSLHVAQKVSSTLSSTGASSVVLNPSQALHGDLGVVNGGDCVLIISHSGASDEIMDLIPMIKRLDAILIALTGSRSTPLAEHCDIILSTGVSKEACPFNLAPTSSTTAAMAAGDALAMVLLEARGFKQEDYAKLHPGGAIGRSLLLKVQDIMRKGPQVASVSKSSTVQEALLEMTKCRTGAAIILEDNDGVAGIFTDGDHRRIATEGHDPAVTCVADVMTKEPITLNEHQLAVDVLNIFSEHKIDDVVVLDDEGRLCGTIDLQDLPRFKIV